MKTPLLNTFRSLNVLLAKVGLKIKVKRNYIGLYFASFLAFIGIGSIMIAVPLLSITLGASSFTLGTLGFTQGLVFISLCFLFGKLSERWYRKNMVVLGFSVYIVAFLFLSLSSLIYQLYLSMLLLGIAGAMVWPALEAWIAEEQSKRSLAQRMALFSVSWSAGVTVGSLLGGILFGINFKLPFYFALAVSTFIFFIILWGTPKVNLCTKSETSVNKTLFSKDLLDNSSLYIKMSRVASFTLWISLGVIRYIFPKLGSQLGISPSFLGVLMFTLSLSQMLTFYALGRIEKWHYRIVPLVSFQLVVLVGLVVVFMTSSLTLFFLAFVFIGVGLGMTYSSSLFYSLNVHSQRGPSAAVHETVLSGGFFLGSLMGGAVAQGFSLRTPYLVVAAVVVIGMFMQILIRRYYSFSNRATTQ